MAARPARVKSVRFLEKTSGASTKRFFTHCRGRIVARMARAVKRGPRPPGWPSRPSGGSVLLCTVVLGVAGGIRSTLAGAAACALCIALAVLAVCALGALVLRVALFLVLVGPVVGSGRIVFFRPRHVFLDGLLFALPPDLSVRLLAALGHVDEEAGS